MFGLVADRLAEFVSRRDLLVIFVMLVLTAGVAAGIPQLDMEDQTDIDDEVFEATDVGEALDYTETQYDTGAESQERALSNVYVRPEGNALSRTSLVAALAYTQAVLEESAVEQELLDGDAVRGPPTLVGTALAGEDADIQQQRLAIENAGDAEFGAAVRGSLGDSVVAGEFMPHTYEPGSTEAESMRLRFAFEQRDRTQQQAPLPDEEAQRVLFEEAADWPMVFTVGVHAQAEWDEAQIQDVMWLIIPPALLVVLSVMAVAYRDLVDVLLGFVGVLVSLVWFFGIFGWLGLAAGFASLIGPVLIVALSIDFGLHVFMRYREQRGTSSATEQQQPTERVREPMRRSTAALTGAFLLVGITAAVGFLANLTSPIGFFRVFGVVITLGVLSAVLIFVTLVPALKVRADTTLERLGFDRRKTAFGTGGRLEPLLSSGVDLAQRGAVVVVVVAVVVGAVGIVGATQVDRQGFQQEFIHGDDWQTELPEPIGWTAHETEYAHTLDYVVENFQADVERDRATTMLIRGNVTDTTVLKRVHSGTIAADESEKAFRQGGDVPVISPLTVIQTVAVEDDEFTDLLAGVAAENAAFEELLTTLADENEAFAAALEEANPDRATEGENPQANRESRGDLTEIYDALYELAPGETANVLERTDGEYRSMRLIVPVQRGLDVDERGAEMHAIAAATEGESDLSVVPVGFATVSNAGLGEVADSVLQTVLFALVGVAGVLAFLYHTERRRASLGVVTVVPIALVMGLIFGGMYVFDVPLTFITAFLVSITIGLGIDYNIHISERFAQELERGQAPVEALYTTVTGTGGALLGSALTSAGAFALLLVHPSPVFQSFGILVVSALVLSFVVSVLVFPSLLLLWARRVYE